MIERSNSTLRRSELEGNLLGEKVFISRVKAAVKKTMPYLEYVQEQEHLPTRKQPRYPSTEEWLRKMWFIHTMEYYAAEKNNDFVKFAGKWMELENVILSEEKKTEKEMTWMVKDHFSSVKDELTRLDYLPISSAGHYGLDPPTSITYQENTRASPTRQS
ncbi:hypothetical protein STEG23_009101, partial [Scotinomys teguina]